MIGTGVSRAALHIDDDLCHTCRVCLAQQVCRVKAIVRIDRDEPPFIDVHRCHNCKICSIECPFDAVVTT
jgi:MinD superfamily P-loop ATPase